MHIGMSKTGTTAVQKSLGRDRKRLASHGILYPKLSGMSHAHHLLMPLFAPPNRCWGRVKEIFGKDPAELRRGGRQEWKTVLSSIKKQRPKRMVLSTESLFRTFPPKPLETFRETLNEVADRTEIVAYVRSPAQFFQSALLENAKRSISVAPAAPIDYRGPIEQYEMLFGTKATVRLYDRNALHSGDIVSDFYQTVLDLPAPPALPSANTSISPEAMEIYQAYRFLLSGDTKWQVDQTQFDLLSLFKDVEQIAPRSQSASLRPEVSRLVHPAPADAQWLKDRFGIDVGEDASLDTSNAAAGDGKWSLRRAFVMDDDRQDQLVSALEARATTPPGLKDALLRVRAGDLT